MNYTTNGILEIPQDIKLELNNGTLTLKAGSKYYKCNGSFTEVTITADKEKTSTANGVHFIYINNNGDIEEYFTDRFYSGSSQPTVAHNTSFWFDTSSNIMKKTTDKGSTWVNNPNMSLPLAIVTVSNGAIYSIDQVFNGFGYIGSTAFALPGVKVLIPNGRNADGTLKNIEFVINNVITRTITWNNSSGQELFIGKYNLNEGIQFISTSSVGQYYKQETEPSLIRYAMWYKPAENKVYRCDLDSNGNLIWKDNFPCYIGQWFTSATSPYPITKLTIRLPFHAVDWNDSSWLSGLGMPSGKNIKLTVGASRTTYTAPANGWFYICVAATANGALYNMFEVNGVHGVMNSNLTANCSYKALMPIIAGRSLYFGYNDLDFTSHDFLGLWFIYAQGEQ